MKQSKKLGLATIVAGIIIVFGSTCLVTGCGGGSSGGNDSGGGNQPPVTPPPVDAPSDPNGAGLPDHVRIYVESTHPNSAKTRAALFQYAKVMEKALADANSKPLSVQHAEESNRANTCIWYVAGSVRDGIEIGDRLIEVILNTDERNKAYFTYNDQLGGQVFKGIPYDERALACDIDPSTLPN